jgi:hypothetical protein
MGQLRRTPGQGVPPAQGPRFGHSGSALRQAGQIIFEEFGGSPGNSYTWVDLIHMPFVAASRRALADLSGCLAELLPPLAHGLVGHANPARRQHFFDHAKAQGKPEIMGWTVPVPQWKNTGRNREWCDDDYNDRT